MKRIVSPGAADEAIRVADERQRDRLRRVDVAVRGTPGGRGRSCPSGVRHARLERLHEPVGCSSSRDGWIDSRMNGLPRIVP